MLYPMATVISYSVMDNVIMNKSPRFIGMVNYKTILEDPIFHTALGNTLYFTILSVIFHLVIGLCFALLLNTKYISDFFKYLFRIFYILPWIFTATIIAVIWRLLLNPNGVINYVISYLHISKSNIEWFSSSKWALHALTFVNIWAGYPFYMVSILAGLQSIPKDYYEAAVIDGANIVQQFAVITIPHLIPIILSIAMLDFIWTMQVFPLVWMATGGGPIHATEMLSTFTYKLAFSNYKFSLAATSAVIILILSLFMAFFYVKKQKIRG
jgi:ABC-type sugar transport systems, permease components